MLVDQVVAFASAILLGLLLNRFEYFGFDQIFLFTLVNQILVTNQTSVQGIGQQRIDRAFVERLPAASHPSLSSKHCFANHVC